MNTLKALIRVWNEGIAMFSNTSYSFFSIEAFLLCIIILLILFNKHQSSSGKNEAQVAYGRSLFVQILYCISGILRVLVDIEIIQKNDLSQYSVVAFSFACYSCICWLLFIYIESSQNAKYLETLSGKIISAIPLIFNILMLFLAPFTDLFLYVKDSQITGSFIFSLMVLINLLYPVAAVILSIFRTKKIGRYERRNLSIISIYPAFLLVCGLLKVINWKIPFLCYALLISDIFVYINYADSLVSVDPLTKIANRNGFMRILSERLRIGLTSPEELKKLERLYLFAVDVDDLGSINSTYGRSEGDKVLVVVANALKKFREIEHPCYISRYYGDEFMLIGNIKDDDELELFIEHIKNYVNNAAISFKLKYKLRVNIGYAKYETYSKTETLAGLIEETERNLDDYKEQKNFQTIWQGDKDTEQNTEKSD